MSNPFKNYKAILFFSILFLTRIASATADLDPQALLDRPPLSSSNQIQAPLPYLQVCGLIDTRTTFSDGVYNVFELTRLAEQRGFEVLFINDHDRLVMEYGLPPFRNIFKKKVELNSINRVGANAYLDAIRQVARKYPDMILIPGAESSPHYYWKGSFFKKNLTAHDHEKRLLAIGLENPEDYRSLPVPHNGFSKRYFHVLYPRTFLFLGALVPGLFLLKGKGFYKTAGILVSLFCLLGLIDTHPFQSSPHCQYDGDQGIAPYQLLIDDINSKNGFAFWNYPETHSGICELGPICLHTEPHPEVLEQSYHYTGFAAVYGDTSTATEPGRQWDRVLLDYCSGKRDQPVWGIATADFHKDGSAGQNLGDFPTIFLVKRKTKADILAALKAGRMYAVRTSYPQGIILNEFSISAGTGSPRATLGEEIGLSSRPRIHISLSFKEPVKESVKVRLIRSGKLLETFDGTLPMKIDYEDDDFEPGQKIYYRLDVTGHGILVANPIFVKFH